MKKYKKDPLTSLRFSEKIYSISVGKKQKTIRILSMKPIEEDLAHIEQLVGTKNFKVNHLEEKHFEGEVEEVLKKTFLITKTKKGKDHHA